MLFLDIVVLVDWRVCLEFVVVFVVDFVFLVEVIICVGCVEDLWSWFKEIVGEIVVDVVVVLVVCVVVLVVVVVVVVGEDVFIIFVVFIGVKCEEGVEVVWFIEDFVIFIYKIYLLVVFVDCLFYFYCELIVI